MAYTLQNDIKGDGYSQSDIWKYLNNIQLIVNELQADMDTFYAAVEGITDKLDGDGGITDTNYNAVHGQGGSGAAIPADLTNSTALKLTKG